MVKVSKVEDFKQLIAQIIRRGNIFLQSINNLADPYDFDQVYQKIIKLSSSYLEVEVDDTNIPFSMKFDLVTIVMEQIHGDEGTNQLISRICNLPSDSELLNNIKKDAKVNIDFANLACILDYFDTVFDLLEYLHDYINTVPKARFDFVINRLSFLLETLSSIIQEKLYNEDSNVLNKPVTEFTLLSMGNDEDKIKKTEVYKLLSVEYPEVLKAYEQAVKTLKRFQTRKSILS